MHILFRQLSQQMGLQNVRGILPEQIDLLLNMSILDILKQTITTNVGLTSQNGIYTNSKIGQINSLKTLYKNESINFRYVEGTDTFELTNFGTDESRDFWSAFYIVDGSIKYKNLDETYTSKYYPIRLIDAQYANNVITDPILKPTIINPIIYNSLIMCSKISFVSGTIPVLEEGLVIADIKIGYIDKPCKVDIIEDISSDMPEQYHNDIVRHAVELYLSSIGVGQRVENNNNRNN